MRISICKFSNFLLCVLLYLFLFNFISAKSQGFKCKNTTTSTCKGMVGYVPLNSTTLFNIQTLFGLSDFQSLLGANSLPLNTSPNISIAAKQTIKIPFPCTCMNGIGISNKIPIYKVKKGDGLDFIARNIFSLLVTYQKIAAVNNISNPDRIDIGQELWIPLPCSCDTVDENQVIHYGHVVAPNTMLDMIANEFGTTEESLLKLNELANAKELKAESVLDVPLRVCTSKVNNTSSDYPLLVSNGTYTFTANNCVKCTCDSNNKNWTLQCEPSSPREIKVQNWRQCPSTRCEGEPGFNLGEKSNSLHSECTERRCEYMGYSNQSRTISASLVNVSTCPGSPQSSPSSSASKMNLKHTNFISLLLNLGTALVCGALVLS